MRTEEIAPQTTVTNSPIKKWYLTTLGKYRVSNIHYTPTLSLIGVVFYSRTWVLIAG